MYSMRQTALISHMNPNTEPHSRKFFFFSFLHLFDNTTNKTRRFVTMQYIGQITVRQTIHVAMGTFWRKIKQKVPSVFFFFFS